MSRLREWLQRLAGTFGGLEAQRDQRGFAWLDIMGRDLRYAVRSLLRDRGSVALAVVALSLGIGATTAVYSVFIAAFPFADSPRVVQFHLAADGKPVRAGSYPADESVQYRARNSVFTHVLGGSC